MPTYLEDMAVGDVDEFGAYDVTEEEIIAFAEKYDPQPFHTDPEAARESLYGGLIASGWHTAAMTMRMLVDGFLSGAASMGSPGIDELRWRAPVYPGDTLSVRTEVVGVEPTHADRGTIDVKITTRNDDGEPVMTMTGRIIIGRRGE